MRPELHASLVVIVDTREQRPFPFPPHVALERASLGTGDYSAKGFEQQIAIERKSLADLVACFGPERRRFWRELERLRAFEFRAVIVEATLGCLAVGAYRSRLHPSAALGSVVSVVHDFACPVIFAESPRLGADITLRLLRRFVERHAPAEAA